MSYIKKFAHKVESEVKNLYLIKGEDDDLACWYYLQVDKLKLPLFKQRLNSLPCKIELTDFGNIVRSGWGEEPSAQIRKKVESGDFSPEPKESDYKIFHIENYDSEARWFYAFVAVPWEYVEKFDYVTETQANVDLREWGKILEIDWGKAPQEKIDYYSNLDKIPA